MAPKQRRKIRRTIFIGLGGTGNEVIRRVKQEMLRHQFDLPLFQYLVLDTVAFNEKPGMPPMMHLRNGEEYLYIGSYNPNEVLKNLGNWPVISSWWGNRTRTNLVTVDEGAGQMRSVGRMGFFYHFNAIEVQLRRMVQEITSLANRESAMNFGYEVLENDPIVYLVFSLCGGTGSSLFFDVAYVIRHMMNAKGLKPTMVGVAMLPGPYIQSISSIPQQERIQANGYAALMELERLNNMALGLEPRPNGKDIWSVQYATNFRVDSADLPFEYTYLIDSTTTNGETLLRDRIYNSLGKAIFWLSGPSTASHFWERAKNLNSKTLASGGQPDASGRKRLTPYSSLGISTVSVSWQLERVQHELENLFIEHIRKTQALKPALPSYLNSTIALVEHVSGEATMVNPVPQSKMFQAPNDIKDMTAIDEMRRRYTEKYQAALGTMTRSPLWQRKREECKKLTTMSIEDQFGRSLRERGPVATVQELDMIRDRLVALMTELDEESQKDIESKKNLEEEYDNAYMIAQKEGLLQQTIENIIDALKRIYVFKRFRRSPSARDLSAMAQHWARQRYNWYKVNYHILVCKDLIKTVLEPLIAHVDKLKATCEDVDEQLELWYEENRELYQVNPLQNALEQIDQVRPRLTEKGQVEEAVKQGRLKVEQKLELMFKVAYERWPKANSDAMADLKPALQLTVTDTLKLIGSEEHLVQRLRRSDVSHKLDAFFRGSSCMWSFTKDVTQNILSHLEPIEILAYGVDERTGITAPDLEPHVDNLLRNQGTRPDPVSTDISDELVLLKTSHGLPVSAIYSMAMLQHAYQVMNNVRGAPYLHIDYADQVRAGYGPLANVAWKHREIIKVWRDEADSIDQSNTKLADEVRRALYTYELALQHMSIYIDSQIEVMDENDLFFEFVDGLRSAFRPLNQTPAVSQALMKFADLEDILHAQGWVKNEPAYGERYNPTLHYAIGKKPDPSLPLDRVVEVMRPGYICYQSSNNSSRSQIRPAHVYISM